MQHHWYVVYTKPRNEKKVVEQLERLGIEAYCPMRLTIRQWSDRKKKVLMPLFPSYCFVRSTEQTRQQVLQAPGVSRFVYWLGKPATLREEELTEVKRWLNEFSQEEISVQEVVVGDRVRFQSGSMKGTEAVVFSKRGNQLVLTLPSLGYQLMVHQPAVLLERVDTCVVQYA